MSSETMLLAWAAMLGKLKAARHSNQAEMRFDIMLIPLLEKAPMLGDQTAVDKAETGKIGPLRQEKEGFCSWWRENERCLPETKTGPEGPVFRLKACLPI
ncbi:hypothetical protein GCM10025772_20860 [Ferrimonas gelatinilytica]|uniref:Uncharacterized protein n=1 Tax=Ferrimonas gelatinilytica TaxID=1255257 RepID=A0ABP9S9X7_9GAMM